jgi:DNA-binding response OmpR family regulator
LARILVIDDETPIRDMIRLALNLHGHEVLQARDGKEGLRLYRERDPDVILTDILMPEQDGLQTIREIQRTRPQAKIIAMSGGSRRWDLPELLPVAEKLGAHSLLYKPFGKAELLQALDAVVRGP